MPNIKQIEGHDNLVKSTASNAVLNTDTTSFENFKSRKTRERETDERINKLENDVSTILGLLTSINEKLK